MRQSWVLLSFSPLLVLVVVGCAVIPTSLPGATSLIGTAIPPSLPSAVNVATTDAQSAFHTAVADSVQPVITSVSPIYAEQIQRIVVKGNNFGSQIGFSGDSPVIQISDLTRGWNAGTDRWPGLGGGDWTTINVTKWTNSEIVVSGFGGDYGQLGWVLRNGDKIEIDVWNAQVGKPMGISAGVWQKPRVLGSGNLTRVPCAVCHCVVGLIWHSEFNGAAGTPPNRTKWNYALPDAGIEANHDLQVYTRNIANAHLNGKGYLVIEARKMKRPVQVPADTALAPVLPADSTVRGFFQEAYSYTSARLQTDAAFSFRYGVVEARIKIPSGKGLWPGFWMFGASIQPNGGGWPQGGEIDIMEHVPALGDRVQATLHGPGFTQPGLYKESPVVTGDLGSWHIYGTIWSPHRISFFLDSSSNIYATFTRKSVEKAGGTWVFNHKFYLLLKLAVGGNWPGPPDGSTRFPAKMYIDWVRVYKLEKK